MGIRMKIILSAFEPFGRDSVNAAWEAAKRLRGPEGTELIKLVLPTEFGQAGEILLRVIEEEQPDAVVCLGQAAGRASITPERVAINVRDARIPDNAGRQPIDEPVVPGAPAAYFSTLPIKEMVAAAAGIGASSSVSNSAGTYVCNDLMYLLLHAANTRFSGLKAGFIHVPCLPEQLSAYPEHTPSMPLDQMTAGLEEMLKVLKEERN